MMRYAIVFAPRAAKQIERFPPNIKFRIGRALSDVLARDPFIGTALKADLKGLYSYRVGDYRILYSVSRNRLIIRVIKVMHRREVYR